MEPIILIPFSTVGQLREALYGLPNDTPLTSQVESADGHVWTMDAAFCPAIPGGLGTAVVLTPPKQKADEPTEILQ